MRQCKVAQLRREADLPRSMHTLFEERDACCEEGCAAEELSKQSGCPQRSVSHLPFYHTFRRAPGAAPGPRELRDGALRAYIRRTLSCRFGFHLRGRMVVHSYR